MAKDNKELTERDQLSEFLLYTTPNGDIKVKRGGNYWEIPNSSNGRQQAG